MSSLALSLGFGGCSDAPEEGGWAASIDTLENGAIRIANRDTPAWEGEHGWSVREDLRIGSLDGNGPDVFGDPVDLLLDDAGRIWVLDRHAAEIRIFDGEGDWVRTVGGAGRGPGEFNQPMGMARHPDGTVRVAERGRFSVLDGEGNFLRTERRMVGGDIFPYQAVPGPGGTLIELGLVSGGSDALFLWRDGETEPVDTVGLPSFEQEQWELTADWGTTRMSVPFSSRQMLRLAPDGVYELITGDYQITKVNLAADTSRVITVPAELAPIPEAMLEDVTQEIQEMRELGIDFDMGDVPNRRPPVASLHVDAQDYLWVRRVAPSDPDSDAPRPYDIVRPDGRWMGSIELPFDLHSRAQIDGETIWTITQDEAGVPWVVRLRVERD